MQSKAFIFLFRGFVPSCEIFFGPSLNCLTRRHEDAKKRMYLTRSSWSPLMLSERHDSCGGAGNAEKLNIPKPSFTPLPSVQTFFPIRVICGPQLSFQVR